MKREYEAIEFGWLGEWYRVTKYKGPNLIEVEEKYKNWLGNEKWRRIYFGHIDPLKETITFFETH